jgi:hypothetical protein
MKLFLFSIFLLTVVCLAEQSVVGYLRIQDAEKLASIQERISKTTPEGLKILRKVQKMKVEVNERLSGKTLEKMVKDYLRKQGNNKIYPIGWSASKKIIENRWRIHYYFQDYREQYITAEWEYNEKTEELYPFEFQTAPLFWTPLKRKVRN